MTKDQNGSSNSLYQSKGLKKMHASIQSIIIYENKKLEKE